MGLCVCGGYEVGSEICQDLKAVGVVLVPEIVLGGFIFRLVV
jgi:hypothetical protein